MHIIEKAACSKQHLFIRFINPPIDCSGVRAIYNNGQHRKSIRKNVTIQLLSQIIKGGLLLRFCPCDPGGD